MDSRCPRKLKSLPSESCPEGRKAVEAARHRKEGGCPWFIADHESHYCFFKYMADNGPACDPKRIAHFLMMDDTEVKRLLNSFKSRVTELLQNKTLEEIFDV